MKIVSMDQDIFSSPYEDSLECLDDLKSIGAEIVAYSDQPIPDEEELFERIKDAEVVFWGVYKIPNSLIDRLTKLKLAVFYGVGSGTFIDEPYCEKKGIKVLNTPGYGNNTVAEYTIGLAFALTRRICEANQRMRNGDWRTQGIEGVEVAGLTYGVVGTGAIGKLVAQKASLLGANVVACDINESDELKDKYNVSYLSLEELMASSDIVSLHLNATKSTENLISRKLILSMKKGSYFINTARSLVVESYEPIYERLIAGTLAGAAIDVFDEEPISSFEPCKITNLITSPHIGYLTLTAINNTLKIAVARTLEFFSE